MVIHPDSAAALDVGAVVAETYEVTRCIGKGGMGAVWEANHLRLPGKKVAIKVLLADIASDAESLARFRREAEVASKLGHPNIVQVVDFNTLPDGAPYLVLELLQGESLDQRLMRGPLAMSETITLVRQIGSGLSAAHRENVIHRDLKPQNLFLCPTEMGGDIATQVKILDFGISKIRGSQTIKTQESTILGTPQYMAPEQATGAHKDVNATTDVFALGAIVYEMLAGQPAFGGQSVPEVVFKVVYEQPAPLAELVAGLPSDALAAVEKALAKKQDERFADVNGFVEAFTGRPLVTLRGQTPAPVATPQSAKVATAETQAAGSEAFAKTAHSDKLPAPQVPMPPMPSAADVVADTGKKKRRKAPVSNAEALASTVATDKETLSVPPPDAGKSRSWLFAVLAVVVIGGGVAAFALTRGGGGDKSGDAAGPVANVTPPPVVSIDAAPAAVPTEPDPPPDAQAAPEVTDEPKHDKPVKKTEKKPPPDEPEPKVNSPIILQAQKALESGNAREAIRLGKKARRNVKGGFLKGQAAAIVAIGYCMQQDLGNVRAWMGKVPRRARRRVLRRCRDAGVDLP